MFVDFDNVYSGLQRLDSDAAKTFAEDAGRWVAALAAGTDGDGPFTRRFLVQRCYLNPVTHARFRPTFTRAGFQVVDCPSLTQQGKSSADINLVLDAMDALAASTKFEEFMILSADADFTPLIVRCRASDRRVTIITPGPAAAAYRAVADTVVAADLFIELLTGQPAEPNTGESGSPAISGPAEDSPNGSAALPPVVSAAASAVSQLVTTSDRPVILATAAQVARQADPTLPSTQWDGTGSFASWLREHLPGIPLDTRTPGYVWDPARFSEADVPHSASNGRRSEFGELQRQVAGITEIPLLDQAAYRQLLDRLAFDLATAPFSRTETSKRVRDDCAEHGTPVGRAAVNFVINGLLLSGTDLDDSPSAGTLAEVWTENVLGLCRGARLEFSEYDVSKIAAWVSGGLIEH